MRDEVLIGLLTLLQIRQHLGGET